MVTPELPPTKLRINLVATGWAACFAIWFVAFVALAVLGDGSPMAYAGLFGLFASGLMVAVLVLVVAPLIRRSRLHDDS